MSENKRFYMLTENQFEFGLVLSSRLWKEGSTFSSRFILNDKYVNT